jgi:hypothetical protein
VGWLSEVRRADAAVPSLRSQYIFVRHDESLRRPVCKQAQASRSPLPSTSAEGISARIKTALDAAMVRAVKLSGSKLKQMQRRGVTSNKGNANRFAANVLPIIDQIKASGVTSLPAPAALKARGSGRPVQVTATAGLASK